MSNQHSHRRYLFEGEEMSIADIRKRVPILSNETIHRHLAAGRNTATAMLSFDGRAAGARSSTKNAKRFNPSGLFKSKGKRK